MPIKIRKTLLHEPITFDTIGNHWDQVPIYRPNGYPLYHYLQTEKGVGKIEIQGKSYLLNENEAQASPDVIFANGKYHMFFCYREASDFRKNKDRSYKIGYAHSTDLISWIRDDSKVGIEISLVLFTNFTISFCL